MSSASASLYVGELDPTVTEAVLFEIFNNIGPVASIRVCRDAVSRRSLGYAYVNYLNADDGERARKQLNYSVIKNRACRIMRSHRDPSLRKAGRGNIFIKNIDEHIDSKALYDTFTAFGEVLSCKVATDEQGRSKGYGFVQYETAEFAEIAIRRANGILLNDKKVYVGHHITRKERQSKLDEIKGQFTNLYVKNIDHEVTQEEFEELFGNYGDVTSAIIQVDEEGRSKGFGFVNYATHNEAQSAVDNLHNVEMKGKKLFVCRAQKKAEREKELRTSYEQVKTERLGKNAGVNLYVKNLEGDDDDEILRTKFEPFGVITSCKVMRNEKGFSKGFGFVCFSSPEDASKAITEMNNKMIGSKPLYVSFAQRREVRKQQLESQFAQRHHMQQAETASMPAGYMDAPPVHPLPDSLPPQSGNMMGNGQPTMIPPGLHHPPADVLMHGVPPYTTFQYGMPGYPHGTIVIHNTYILPPEGGPLRSLLSRQLR